MTDHLADLLAAAATRLRAAATEATHNDRTTWQLGHTLGTRTAVVLDDPDKPTVLIETYAERLERVNAYLALVGPATGLAVADWLAQAARTHRAAESAARRVWREDGEDDRAAFVAERTDHHALAVARAVLGQDGGQQQ
nr:hypothetical protein KitaXyl93_20540 [Kitasatospora sp. Xyl93]